MANIKRALMLAFLLAVSCPALLVICTNATDCAQNPEGCPENQAKSESPILDSVIQMLNTAELSPAVQPEPQNVPAPATQSIPVSKDTKPKQLQVSVPVQPQSVATAHFIEHFQLAPEQQKERAGKILLSLQAAIRRAKRDPKGTQKVVALEKAFSKAILRVHNIRRSRRRRHRSRSSSRSAHSTNVRRRVRTRRSRSNSRSSSTNSSSSSSSSSNSNSFHLSWSSSTTDSSSSVGVKQRNRKHSSTSSSGTTIRHRRHHHRRHSTSSSSSTSSDEKVTKRRVHHKKHRGASSKDPSRFGRRGKRHFKGRRRCHFRRRRSTTSSSSSSSDVRMY